MLLVAPVLLAFHIHVSEMLDSLLFASCSVIQEQKNIDTARKRFRPYQRNCGSPLKSPIITLMTEQFLPQNGPKNQTEFSKPAKAHNACNC